MPTTASKGASRRMIGAERIRRTIVLGMRSLWLHRLRSLLTVLGIVFGVCSVIAMLAVGEGASSEAQEQIRRLGSNNIILRSVKPVEQERASSGRSYVLEYGITYADVEAIRETIPGVRAILPARLVRKEVWNAHRRMDVEILGTVPEYTELQDLKIEDGTYFSQIEMDAQRNVCVLGATVADQLFPLGRALGSNIRIDSDYYRVIGVMEPESNRAVSTQPEAGEGGGSIEAASVARIYIPLTAATNRFGEVLMKRRSGSFEAERVELHEAIVQVERQEDVQDVAQVVGEMLSRKHKKMDYELIVPLELLRQAERTKQIFNIVLGAIAAISLIVGGIGIMNIMLASVTERTREIGIRRALGAKRRDIVTQFLIETVILAGVGGALGVALGVTIPFFIEYFAAMPTIVTPWAPALAFSISALVGVIFGIYPAMRAAQMDPVEALRHE